MYSRVIGYRENDRLQGELPVTENSAVPTITGKKVASSPLVTVRLPVAEVCCYKELLVAKVGGQEVYS